MKFICDTCFDLYPSGSIADIPGTVVPTNPWTCSLCASLVTPGIHLTGHVVDNNLPSLNFIPIPVSGSR